MHPNVFLKTFWRLELKPQVFVAMSFADDYRSRFYDVISPAIRALGVGDEVLEPYRVDVSKSGDSILTDIMEGVAHSRLVLADVSSVGKDSKTGESYRNGNVMYEVGLALACRQPSEVLLVRDDRDKFLFDVSTVPHMYVDFTDTSAAIASLCDELSKRLLVQEYFLDARVELALASLGNHELEVLMKMAESGVGRSIGWKIGGTVVSVQEAAIMRLLDKRIVRAVGRFEAGHPAYQLTPLGWEVANAAKSRWPSLRAIADVGEKISVPKSEVKEGGDGQ